MSETTKASASYLTKESYERLQAELSQLSGPGRTEIAKRIEAAREEGDLRENGGYHAAKEEQGKAEARIRYLQQLLDNSYVGEAPASDGTIAPGQLIKATVAGRSMEFIFGNREIAGSSDLSVYSEKSPLGEAINGAAPGDKVSYAAPNGKDIEVEIISAEPFTG